MFDIVTTLCARFPALSPFDIFERPARDVFDLYIDAVIQVARGGENGNATGSKGNEGEPERVYSWNASWH